MDIIHTCNTSAVSSETAPERHTTRNKGFLLCSEQYEADFELEPIRTSTSTLEITAARIFNPTQRKKRFCSRDVAGLNANTRMLRDNFYSNFLWNKTDLVDFFVSNSLGDIS